MAEGTEDPRDYRGGVHEPADAKGGAADNEGIVPREMLDDPPPQENADEQTLKDDVMGEVTGDPSDEEHTIDRTAGDQADATTQDDSANVATVHTEPTQPARTGQGEA
jgi:hypothetical protein